VIRNDGLGHLVPANVEIRRLLAEAQRKSAANGGVVSSSTTF
jgi:hypothetical protein